VAYLRAGIFDNSPAFLALGIIARKHPEVPPWTKELFCRSSRDFYIRLALYPALKGWAIIGDALLRSLGTFSSRGERRFRVDGAGSEKGVFLQKRRK
jgi:hypothetical protein